MKTFSTIQLKLLHLLQDRKCHSGQQLGKILGVSRTSIWKHICLLINLGIPIKRLPQSGYQLERPFIPLDAAQIGESMGIELHVFSEIDSTNRYLKTLAPTTQSIACCAETQTAGRGRFGRPWISPFGENIYLSYRQQLTCSLSQLSGLSLVASLAVHSCLQPMISSPLQIKWPNDLYWQHKKLAGILIEMLVEENGCIQLIIGVGINVNSVAARDRLISKPYCSLYSISEQYFDRNVLIGRLLQQITQDIDTFMQKGFPAFRNQWQELDYLFGKNITVQQLNQQYQGQASGVDDAGQLLLKDEAGLMHRLTSGDASISL